MTKKELMSYAMYGIERKIVYACNDVVETSACRGSISELKGLLSKYDEIVQEYEAARKEEEDTP